jgi:membrane-bound lytic murein transglycosylase D
MVGFLSVQAESPTVPNNIEFAGLNLKLSDKARKKIQTEVDALTRSPKYFQVKVDRLQIYFPIIERIFREEGLPEDFKYLVLQESALISDAVSSSNAVGFWQFKTAAATEVGLRVDRNVDERLNIVASTRGAAKYIKKNNRLYFDNWVHAVLAYQQGPGGAQRLVDKKFSGSSSMPIDGHTHWYVIKVLAHKVAFEQVRSAEPSLFLVEFYDGKGESLKEISQQHSLDVELVKQNNKWLNQSKVPTDREYSVILPYNQQPRMLASSENSKV